MQPYRDGAPIGNPEMCPEDAKNMQNRISELLDRGADEVRVFRANDIQLNNRLKEQGMNREQRREWIKNHGKSC